MQRGVTATLDTARFDRAVSAFLRRQAPEAVDRSVRRIAFGVTQRIVTSLNGTGANPKRVDTGRYRAAWGVGLSQATGQRVPGAPASTDPQNPSTAGDSTGTKVGRGLSVTVTVQNNVEYGEWIEFGTESMTAGLHRASALQGEGRVVAKLVGGELAKAWNR